MTAKTYLAQYRIIKSRLRAVEAMIREIREELSSLGPIQLRSSWPDGQPHGTGTTDPTGNRAAAAADSMSEVRRQQLRDQLMELEAKELRARSELWKQRIEIEDAIGKVQDAILQDLLRSRYIEGKSFELIAVEMNYTYRHIMNLHGEALSVIEKALPKELFEKK